MLRTPSYTGASLSPAIITSGSLSFIEDTHPRGMAKDTTTRPAVLQSAERKISYYGEARKRRRRSSSLMYHEPPETLEHQSDQTVNPNLNAQWVNAKGMIAAQDMDSTDKSRRLDHSPGPDHPPEDRLRHRTIHNTRDLLDTDEHHIYVRLVSHVPLGKRSTIRVQFRGLRQPEYVGANRQWRSIHTS